MADDKWTAATIALAEELCNCILRDEGGMPPPSPAGNGGLISRETLLTANKLRNAVASAKKERARS